MSTPRVIHFLFLCFDEINFHPHLHPSSQDLRVGESERNGVTQDLPSEIFGVPRSLLNSWSYKLPKKKKKKTVR